VSPRVDPTAVPDPARDLALTVTLRRIRDLCEGPKAFIGPYPEGMAVWVDDVLAILNDPDPLGH
jgi:hypothetical protein